MKRSISLAIGCLIAIGAALVFADTFMTATAGTVPLFADTGTGNPPPLSAVSSQTEKGYTKDVSVIPDSYPVRLAIPALSINAAVQDVGITAKGAVGAPNNFTDVGWYEYGTTPGDNGTAIIDGHVDNGLALAGVFKHLSDIQAGDDIVITTEGGRKLDFVVTAVNIADYQHVPMSGLMLSTSSPMLTLITCDGTWVGDQRTYNERLMVSASLKES